VSGDFLNKSTSGAALTCNIEGSSLNMAMYMNHDGIYIYGITSSSNCSGK